MRDGIYGEKGPVLWKNHNEWGEQWWIFFLPMGAKGTHLAVQEPHECRKRQEKSKNAHNSASWSPIFLQQKTISSKFNSWHSQMDFDLYSVDFSCD